jgi:hypothetical protein
VPDVRDRIEIGGNLIRHDFRRGAVVVSVFGKADCFGDDFDFDDESQVHHCTEVRKVASLAVACI